MSDRELLELAAKAAGMRVFDGDKRFPAGAGWFFNQIGANPPALYDVDRLNVSWRPLTDDGDALRLAVKLEIEVVYYLAEIEAQHDQIEPLYELRSEHSDAAAAARRAIVRAAAEIGKEMK